METSVIETKALDETSVLITSEALLNHWQGHRRLSRKMIEVFPEHEYYNFSIGGMRTYADLTMEMIDLAGPGIEGIVTDDWKGYGSDGDNTHTGSPKTKEEVLALWDSVTAKIDTFWAQIPLSRFSETTKAFGQYEDTVYSTILYFIDNEIHHRAQGYVYLRALGVEPPAFWDRY